MESLIHVITSADPRVRNRSLDEHCREASLSDLLGQCEELESFRRTSGNLLERVRACFFLYALHRFQLPAKPGLPAGGRIPYEGYLHLLGRRFEEAVDRFLSAQIEDGPSDALSSALAATYHKLAFQNLADQVRRSVRSARGNQWMFRVGHPLDQALRVRQEMLRRPSADAPFPVLREATPVRMDLTHSAWSDIFFLGMDFPEGARVLNVSIDLGVRGRDPAPRPPVETYLRVIDEPVLRLASVDLSTTTEVVELDEVFDFARDYLGLLKAALIASGLVPPGLEGSGQSLARPARTSGRPRPRDRAGEQRQRHPEGVAPRRLDQPPRLAHQCLHARDRPDSQRRRAARRSRPAAGRGAGHPRRVARGFGRRLAGLGRRLARHQGHRRAGGDGGRPRVRKHTRAPAPDPPHPRFRGRPRREPSAVAGRPRAGARRDGAERRAGTGDGHGEAPAALEARMGGAVGGG